MAVSKPKNDQSTDVVATSINESLSPDELFDELMKAVGNWGRFHTRFNFLYNFLFTAFMVSSYLNIVLAVTVPAYWCHVPGRELTNYSLEEWKALTLPNETEQLLGVLTRSCQMFNSNNSVVDCEHGFEYDRQWYDETAATQEDWVCGKELNVANTFVAGRVGETLGTLVFGQLGDRLGRRPVFYVCLVLLVVGRTSSAFTAHYYIWFLLTILMGSMANNTVFQTPTVVSMEVSAADKRSHVVFIHCLGWVVGMCFLGITTWLTRNWALMMLITTLPCVLPLLAYRYLPESPRWLAGRGKVSEAIQTLEHIAQVNGTKVPTNISTVLQKIASKKEKTYGALSLFSSWRLTKNTTIIMTCWIISGLSYYVLILNVTNMSGNPFLNFLLQSIVELPGYFLGTWLSDRYGRRCTHATAAFLSAAIACVSAFSVLTDSNPWVLTLLVSCLKLCCTCSFYIIWLQAMEIYPTCVRQTGTSIGATVANIVDISAPYIVYLGTSIDIRIPYAIIACLMIIVSFSSTFLPETLNQKLPETLDEAKTFGQNQRYCDFIYKDKK